MRYPPGTRVSWTSYGTRYEGTVLDQRSRGIVWVLADGKQVAKWLHVDSVTHLYYTPEAGFML